MPEPFDLPFVQRGVLEIALLATAAGVLGTWIVLRGMAFFAHAAGTAAFPGVVLADGLGFAAGLGALGAALGFALAVGLLARGRDPRGEHAALDGFTALALVGALALGVVLASDVFDSTARVDGLLFGSLLTIDAGDLWLAAIASVVAVAATLALGRTWLVTGFDRGAARALGARARAGDAALLALVALTVAASLPAVGALLVAALLVVPAATTRLFTDRLATWQVATIALTLAEGVGGLWLSVELDVPPGATIAVLCGGLFAVAAIARTVRDLRPRTRAPRAATTAGALAIAVAALVAGCSPGYDDDDDRLDVVATTTQVADMAREVGGERVDVRQLLQPGTDPHDYEPRPSDVEATARAKVVLESGAGLDAWTEDVIESGGGDPEVVDLAERIPRTLPGEDGGTDPHWWHDPRNVRAAVIAIRDALAKADPSGAAAFRRNADRYLRRVAATDAAIERCLARIPAERRKLVTDHDAFAYLAARYGIEVVGTAIPAKTTAAQASASDLAQLAEVVRRERVPAVFPAATLEEGAVRTIARETGARSDLGLYSDTLGPSGSPGGTYLGMLAANARAIAEGLGEGEGAVLARTDGLTTGYGGTPALEDVTFAVAAGERIAVLGPNGGGKSTLLRALLGELPPWRGSVEVEARCAIVPQGDRGRLDYPVSALDVALMGTLSRLPWWRRPGRAERGEARGALASVGLEDRASAPYGTLSGGQRQRVLIARALVMRARLLLLDEPYAGLDAPSAAQLTDLIDALARDGHGIVMTTHHIEQARRFEGVLLLNRRQTAFGPPEQTLDEENLRAIYGTSMVVIGGHADAPEARP